MFHVIKSIILLFVALCLFMLTLILAQDLIKGAAEVMELREFTRPLLYTAVIAAYFDILVLISEALPISHR